MQKNSLSNNTIFSNAIIDGKENFGWFIGHFIKPENSPRSTNAIEVKWASYVAGDKRTNWSQNVTATTISVLFRGRFHVIFSDKEYIMTKEGDYVLTPPGVTHSWYAEQDTIILTIRWPSSPGDSVQSI